MASGSFLISHGKHGMGMLLPQRSSSMTNVFRTQKVPFVTMIHVEEKIGLPPVRRLKIKYKALNNNVMIGNKLRPKKNDRPHEKYCSLTVDKQFWRKNINPYLEMKREPWELTGNKIIDRFNSNKFLSEELSKNKSKQLVFVNNGSDKKNIINESKEDNNNNNDVKKVNKKLKRGSRNKLNYNSSCVNWNNKMELTKEEVSEKNIITVDNDINDKNNVDDLLEEGEIQNIVNYMSGLDYEKYSKDMEIKEALQLLKYKMEKQAEEMKDNNNNIKEDNNDNNDNNNNDECNKSINKCDVNENETTKDNENEVCDDNNNKIIKPIINEQEEKKQEEIDKFKIAEKISKNKTLRKVHSCKSIQRLLDREGINKIEMIDTNKLKPHNNNNNKLPSLVTRNKHVISVPDI